MVARWLAGLALLGGGMGCGLDRDGDGHSTRVDCDDTDPAIHPDAAEVCNGLDDDCDGLLDVDAVDARTFYADADGDGHAGTLLSVQACAPPPAGEGAAAAAAGAWFTDATDCDDLHPQVSPSGQEVCGGLDDDCDGLIDDADDSVDPSTFSDFYPDGDGDGHGADAPSVRACAPPPGHVAQARDCDDTDPERYPDRDWHADRDGDGFGAIDEVFFSCTPPAGFLADASDCDDLNPQVSPAGAEVCNSLDDDCDGLIDDADDSVDPSTFLDLYRDDDGDGYGADDQITHACAPSVQHVAEAGDCDDTDDAIHPDAAEVCNDAIDNNCDARAWPCGFAGDNLPSDAGLRIAASGGNLGYDFAVADLDGDGQADLILPAYATGGGEIYLRHGPLTADLTLPTEADAQLNGASVFDYAGKSLDAGDADGDGYADLLIGAYGVDDYGNLAGAAFLAYGDGAPLSGILDLEDVADRSWFGGASDDYLGTAVRFVGDLDGDGYDDLALGATGYDNGDGALFLVYGGLAESGSGLGSAADACLQARQDGDLLGELRSIAGGDLDGDGLSELAVRAAQSDLGARDAGAVALFYGGARLAGDVSLADADATFFAGSDYAELGAALTVAGDLDGDGYRDLMIGATAADPIFRNEGAAYLLPGGLTRYAGDAAAAALATATLTGAAAADAAGAGLAPAGDFNDDGHDDLLLGALGVDDGGQSAVGAAYLFWGPLSGSRSVTTADATLRGDAPYAYVGMTLAAADINGDRVSDILISVHGEDEILIFLGGDF